MGPIYGIHSYDSTKYGVHTHPYLGSLHIPLQLLLTGTVSLSFCNPPIGRPHRSQLKTYPRKKRDSYLPCFAMAFISTYYTLRFFATHERFIIISIYLLAALTPLISFRMIGSQKICVQFLFTDLRILLHIMDLDYNRCLGLWN